MSTAHRRGVFLDLDGTLVDNLSLMYDYYIAFMQARGIEGHQGEFDRLNGVPLEVVVAELKKLHDLKGSVAELLPEYLQIVEDGYAAVGPRQGAIEFLDQAQTRNIVTCLVTSAPQDLATRWIDAHLPRGLMDFVVSGDDVELGKPAPDPYLLGLTLSRADPRLSVAVEDSVHGIMSASGAALKVVQMKQTAADELLEGAWKSISTFSALMECIDAI